MTPTQNTTAINPLDHSYAALAEATTRVGEARAPLFLATLALSMMARYTDSAEALVLIAQAERLSAT